MQKLVSVLCFASLVAACSSTSSTVPPAGSASPARVQGTLLVFTKWTPDSSVLNGPEPGFKPALTGLTGHDVSTAHAKVDATGLTWVVDVAFTSRGRDVFRQLTHDSVQACPDLNQDCPQRHLAIWLDLSRTDIDHWTDTTYVDRVAQAYDLRCLAQQAATVVCAKLLMNPVVLQEIAGGSTEIAVNFTQQSAAELAASINATAHS